MTFIDWFAGVGGFRRGMELAGHKCVGFCEWDKYATASYTSMHLITDNQRDYLSTLDLRKRQKEILKKEYRNGEWYTDDIRRVYAGDIPKSDCWCFGFPCQDISICGYQVGFKGNRSSLFFRVMYLLGQLDEEERPEWLFIENVKNLLSVNGGWDFARLLVELDEGGYDAEWQVLNSRYFGVPQNRERVFIVGHNRRNGAAKVLPVRITNGRIGVPIERYAHNKGYRRVNQTFTLNSSIEALDTMRGGSKQPCVVLGDKRIRRLTPKECFRLQGWADDYFEKAQFVNSDNQLYKQAGNGVTVSVIEAIARKFGTGIKE